MPGTEALAPVEDHPLEAAEGLAADARAWACSAAQGRLLDSGEGAFEHARGVEQLLERVRADELTRALPFLLAAWPLPPGPPQQEVAARFGAEAVRLAEQAWRLMTLGLSARRGAAQAEGSDAADHAEQMRRLLLALGQDLRIVIVRLASRLQTLRHYAASKRMPPKELAQESLEVFAPVANRLGVWQYKWEIEDLAFRFLQPEVYKQIARSLDAKRAEREGAIERVIERLRKALDSAGVAADVAGRPKHIYSIWRKMQGKALDFDQVMDVRALRVLVDDVPSCYAALSVVHANWQQVDREFDDYIARPKSNGYQSLHTVVRDADGEPFEVQIRTHAMHRHAEFGVAAHWAYKEAGARGYGGVAAAGQYEQKIALVRQLIAMQRELGEAQRAAGRLFDDRIYVLTPQARIVELAAGATPVDFAYALHTDLGHRCRGARVDGKAVPLSTPLATGQTVEITVAKEGGPSRDWLNPERGYLVSARARAKVRAWFNAQAQRETIERGRAVVERLMQRSGRTAVKLAELAERLGFRSADALFDVVGKDEYSTRSIELALESWSAAAPAPTPQPADEEVPLQRARADGKGGGDVLVVGVDDLLTQLARCCKPAPPDAIGGFVARGKGVSVHRANCSNFRAMAARSPGRVIPVDWGQPKGDAPRFYPIDVVVEAQDRQGLLRDIGEAFAQQRINVVAASTQTLRRTAFMRLTVEVSDADTLNRALARVAEVEGVRSARRK
jgi:GTP pyrophosphokinase